MIDRRLLLGSAGALALGRVVPALAADAPSGPPVARVAPVTENLWGVNVTDPYRWMEKSDSEEFQDYLKAQGAYARKVLDPIPGREALVKRVQQLSGVVPFVTQVQVAGPWIFTQVRPAGADTYKLMVRKGLDGKDRVLIDPDKLAKAGSHVSLDYWAASPDGAHVAYGTSPAGGEQSTLRVMVTETGEVLPEAIDRTNYASPSWLPDGSGFFYNRLAPDASPTSTDYYKLSAAWLHRLGSDPKSDAKVLAAGLYPDVKVADIEFPVVFADPSSDILVGALIAGVQNELTLYAGSLKGALAGAPAWTPVCTPDDQVTGVAVRGDDLYLLSHKGASRFKVLHATAAAPSAAKAAIAAPPGPVVLRNVLTAKDGVYLVGLDAGLGNVRKLTPGGGVHEIALPFKGAISSLYADTDHDGLWFMLEGWVRPPVLCHVDARGVVTQTDVVPKPPVDVTPYRSVEVMATAKDGVKVPLSIVYRADTPRDGSAPCILEAYGAYGVTEDPGFIPRNLAFLDQGGVFAVAHVRGGGELGEDWHKGGQKLTKSNTWRDDIACAEYLIASKWTSRSKLAVRGTSAGGITAGRFLTERPDLPAVVISRVGVSNAMRSEFSPNGPPNIPEFGTVTEQDGFKALYAMDALQHVKDGTRYPAVMLTTGLNDPRVSPWEPGKMAARLQKANASSKPIILRVESDAGHGVGSTRTQRDVEEGEIFAFVLWQTGDVRFQPRS